MTPLVMFHGFTGSPGTFDDVVAALPPGRPVFRPYLAGHGSEPFPADVATFGHEVDRLARQVAAWTPDPVHLVGYSLGARLALSLLLDHPTRVARATLIGVNPGLESPATRAGRRGQDAVWSRLLEQGDLAHFVDMWERQPLFATTRSIPPSQREAQRHERLGHDPLRLARAMRVLGLGEMPNFAPRLRSCTVPLELVVGELDTPFRDHAARILAVRPDLPLRVVPGVGHNVPRESPLALARLLSEDSTP
jgi:2-succinyl-6-hydroxy-2,4-cyclohexadiene-1-carboxylate synthase